MLKAGVRVALATDSVASNNNLNMLEEMKILALTQKGRLRDPVVLKPAEAIQMATKTEQLPCAAKAADILMKAHSQI